MSSASISKMYNLLAKIYFNCEKLSLILGVNELADSSVIEFTGSIENI